MILLNLKFSHLAELIDQGRHSNLIVRWKNTTFQEYLMLAKIRLKLDQLMVEFILILSIIKLDHLLLMKVDMKREL